MKDSVVQSGPPRGSYHIFALEPTRVFVSEPPLCYGGLGGYETSPNMFCPRTRGMRRAPTFSSSRNYVAKFKNVKNTEKKNRINFKSLNNNEYNNHFNLLELKDAIKKSNDTATGPDEIHYQMLKHLPENALSTLLNIFNDIWAIGVFPDCWRLVTVKPIPKPGTDHAEPTKYRPIALTSCLCKTLERMINKRLVWYLESNDLISPIQSGFRSEHSTNDHLIRLETFIRDAFVNREHVVSVFFDLEKAYDTTW